MGTIPSGVCSTTPVGRHSGSAGTCGVVVGSRMEQKGRKHGGQHDVCIDIDIDMYVYIQYAARNRSVAHASRATQCTADLAASYPVKYNVLQCT